MKLRERLVNPDTIHTSPPNVETATRPSEKKSSAARRIDVCHGLLVGRFSDSSTNADHPCRARPAVVRSHPNALAAAAQWPKVLRLVTEIKETFNPPLLLPPFQSPAENSLLLACRTRSLTRPSFTCHEAPPQSSATV